MASETDDALDWLKRIGLRLVSIWLVRSDGRVSHIEHVRDPMTFNEALAESMRDSVVKAAFWQVDSIWIVRRVGHADRMFPNRGAAEMFAMICDK